MDRIYRTMKQEEVMLISKIAYDTAINNTPYKAHFDGLDMEKSYDTATFLICIKDVNSNLRHLSLLRKQRLLHLFSCSQKFLSHYQG